MLPDKIIYEGKAKFIIETKDPLTVIQYFKDEVTAFNKEKYKIIEGKGTINNRISTFIMETLEKAGINTHFIKTLSEREQLVKKLKIIPLEIVVRNIAAGSFCKRFNIKEGEKLAFPIIEFFYKNDGLADPMVNENHVLYFGWLSYEEMEEIKTITIKINTVLIDLFLNAGIDLVDLKLEFGRPINDNTKITLADEISPDNCRLWDKNTHKKLDKDVFRLNLGNLKEAYLEVAKRLSVKLC
ncbi:phosphoribosylaminoimidazolesuccinocarboxamide synthase [Wolbachia endosymbiont of Brugia malayi]|uniref:Phosphoribosylaminoimidazole-succinocarboxamide synthase n=1 Tax=Wolbachia sp. subsp. Brugia malayi (strain TRS) TaxID=292805 RepID=PUR7_WOLTR|nr:MULTISPECIES: phosphoribosylaminoimidazolesuccinocarboxamide synthase [unclassified Wolbachia]Q5GT56.1 RecName: Full=Phosphoribosylaminoimidazole-succinocarboxamide synthase; AltName: Full=SAICAR synthetase [Wolbachia endosymbiont strain TRS of Brugia malayi]AAW70818.1 Phosphoribosylaminoimidazolesuccinocarboxamide (SAICAR) synthase [Wolbachia endosymbiont strain TRS of Brugia malayi]QCB61784.1 phosphoribosylaminoimidazolesuccinocarboxamide synthase [Wolbachia endosymbiont of Brugia malayi]Q